MKKIRLLIILCAALSVVPFSAFSSDQPEHGADHHAGAMEMKAQGGVEHANHEHRHKMSGGQMGMSSPGAMLIVGSQVSKGVKGMAHIKNVSAAMSEMGLPATHHFMITFVDETTGKSIDMGTVALKITNPDAKVAETVELKGMDGHFGADLVLDMKGEYHFKLGTRLADGKQRKFHFHQVID